ncbi:MAG: histidine kinase [Betaproteobacteria bacterium HGW-Betaproteobacteria-10]|nr:MAG: histidine kinase [Betaproteobacteria bacterium HGW-Betaproteobacteria-10]
MSKLPEPILHAIESGRVPSPPQLLLRLLQMVDDEGTTTGELAKLVGQDPGLSTRILSVANSPALRRGAELRSLENCLTSLGTRLVRSIATCLSIQSLFDRRSGISPKELTGFWSHALWLAELSRSLADLTGYPHPDEAYLGGLLHDVGQLILLSALGEPYAQLLANSPDEEALQVMETRQFGAHHGEIGTWLADKWHLDASFADGILFHHASPEEILTAGTLPKLIWLAHSLVSVDEVTPAHAAQYQDLFGFASPSDLEKLRDQAEARTRQIAEALGLAVPTKLANIQVWATLKISPATEVEESDAEGELSAMVGSMALLQPLQQDLFALESDAEVLLSLRESARILFDLNRVAFLISQPDGKLSGAAIGGQPAIFRQVDLPPAGNSSLVTSAAMRRAICSTFDERESTQVSLIDVQFARALGSPGLLCIPMIARNRVSGVMICGLSAAQQARLSRRLPWLLNFGRIAAISLETLQEARSYRANAEHEASSRFSSQARRIVHEAGNPLGIIRSYLKILDRKLPEDTGVRQELEILTEEIDRVVSIVGRMSEIPEAAPAVEGQDVGDLVSELLLLYRDPLFAAKGIGLEFNPPGVPLRVDCERDGLKQILLNLWKNASEALSRGQRVRILLTDHVVHNGNSFIQIRLDDSGPGMSEAAMRSIHRAPDPANTGKRGLGLSIVGELATRQGISVTCRSQIGKGTSITLLLPKFQSARQSSDAAFSLLSGMDAS